MRAVLKTILLVGLNSLVARPSGIAAPLSKNYYLNSLSGDDAKDGLAKTRAWKSLKNIQGLHLAPGDSILSAANSEFKGGFMVESSGTAGHPTVIATYGTGLKPALTNDDFNVQHGNVILIKGAHVIIDGLLFRHCASSSSKVDKEILSVGAVYAATGADYCRVQNCEFNDCPIGVSIQSQHCTVSHNELHDCNRFLSRPDWGPIGIVIGNAWNEVCYNCCRNYVNIGGNYGADGGFVELDDRYFGNRVHDVNIHHNRSTGNMGFLEIETNVRGDSLNVSYNLSDDYQQFVFYWGGNHSKIINNTVIRTKPSLNGAVNTVFTMTNGDFEVRNNIFVVANGIQVFVTAPYKVGNYSKVRHDHNLYYSLDQSTTDPCGLAKGAGEIVANPLFADPGNGDYHLKLRSPAQKAGTRTGYSHDLQGKLIKDQVHPNMGAYEFDIRD